MNTFNHQNSYERIYKKSLSPEKVSELQFNLLSYIRLLIEMDKQHREWLKNKESILDRK